MLPSLEDLKKNGDAPEWLSHEGYETLSKGYLLSNETPRELYKRVANSAAKYLKKPELSKKFYKYIDNNWLCLSSPICSNSGTDRGMVISCFGQYVPDTLDGIYKSFHETALLTKNGGGIGKYWGGLRARGSDITGNGSSDGIIPWLKVEEATLQSTSQGGVRRGSGAQYLDISSNEIEEFIDIRRNTGDSSRRCVSNNFHHAVNVSDEFMSDCKSGNVKARELWTRLLTARLELGEPYLMFKDTANRTKPDCYKKHNLPIHTSQLCLSGDTEVLTKEYGPVPISELVGQKVHIFDGNSWVFNDKFTMTSSNQKLLKISLRDGSSFMATPYHKLFLSNGDCIVAEDLKIGNKLEYHTETTQGTATTNGAYLKGFLIAEGTQSKGKPILWLYDTKYMCKDRLIQSTLEVAPVDPARSTCIINPEFREAGSNRNTLNGLGKRRTELLPWTTVHKESFPDEIYSWNTKTQSEFLSGLFDGDGTVVNSQCAKCYQLASIHKDFIYGLQAFLKTKGVYSSIGLMRKAGECDFNDGYGIYKTKDAWRITISNISARTLSKLCTFSRLINFETSGGYDRKPTFAEVKAVEELDGEYPVYCTTVETTHKFALANGLMSGNCNEIFLNCDEDHTFVCCLSSLNLARWEEWKDTDLVQTAIWFLDGIMEEFIQKSDDKPGFDRALNFARKSRALGLGVLGWHTLLQSKLIPFDSFDAMQLNAKIFRTLDDRSLEATKDLAKEYGEVAWTKGCGIRNTHRLAVAPTVSNSLISGGASQGIEPLIANYYAQKTAKGTFIRKNPQLEWLLKSKNKDTFDTWEQINQDGGSVRSLNYLSVEEKAVFATAREINQFAIVRQAGQRQKYIDQGQSVNLFFAAPSDISDQETKKQLGKYIHKVHLEAYELGLKGLYYLRPTSVLKGDQVYRDESDCKSCES